MNASKRPSSLSLAACLILPLLGSFAQAQDSVNGKEPIVASIDVSKLTYDYLVDGTLAQDDPANKKFKTFQAAYAAAPAGTAEKPTVIGIKPNVYFITGTSSTPGMTLNKNYITLLGLTNNRRSVVFADNRGNKQGGGSDTTSYNGQVFVVNANGFTAKNLTFLNYCNVDYVYPGDPGKNLSKRSGVITQAVVLQASGDKHLYENVAILSRLDTMFLSATRSYFKDVYIEGTDDFIGGGQVSVWENCEVVFPTGNGVMAAGGITFINTKFTAIHGLQFAKGAGRGVALINCVLPVYAPPQSPVAWVRGNTPPRIGPYSYTYHSKDANGKPLVIADGSLGTPAFTYSRELSDEEVKAFNPWNELRATPTGTVDDWDPAGAKAKYEAAGQGSLIFRMALTGGPASIRTGGTGVTLSAAVSPARASDKTVTWTTSSNLVTLSQTTGDKVTVTGNNTGEPAYVSVKATAVNGCSATAWIFVEPKYTEAPAVIAGPVLNAPAKGTVSVNYTLNLGRHEDQSLISWYTCDDAAGTNPRAVAVSRGNEPLRAYPVTLGDVGRYLKVSIKPKHNISDPGAEVFAMAAKPIVAADVKSSTVSPNFKNFVPETNATYVNGAWTILGTWTSAAGDGFTNGYGVRPNSQGASLLYQQDGSVGDMQVNLILTPEKTEGMVFGSPGSGVDGDRIQKCDIFIKYDPRTKNGYSVRYWRTTQSAEKCMYQLYQIVNGVGSPISDQQVLTGVAKQNTHMNLRIRGNVFSVKAYNDVDAEVLSLESKITPNLYGGAGTYWSGSVPRGNGMVYSLFEISYADTDRN